MRAGAARAFRRWRDAAAASDPGWNRLLIGLRAAGNVGLAVLVLWAISGVTGQPVAAMLVGLAIATLSAIAVKDERRRDRALTFALIAPVAAAAVTVGTLLEPWPAVNDAVFVAVMFTAAFVRPYGARWSAVGMAGFMAYFFAAFARAPRSEVPWLVVSVLAGVVCSMTVMVLLLPGRSTARLHQARRALDANVAASLRAAAVVMRAPVVRPRHERRLRRAETRTVDAALVLDQLLEQLAAGPRAATVRAHIVQLEAATGRVLAAVAHVRRRPLGAAGRERSALALEAAATAARAGPANAPGPEDDALPGELRDALTALVGALALGPPPPVRDEEAGGDGEEARPEVRAALRQATRVATAGAAAILVGGRISPSRWYWAVIAAFVVFSGTSTSTQTAYKAALRIVGTVTGVVVALAVADLVGPSHAVAFVALFLAVFAAYYSFQVSYGLMVFWITLMLAVLYTLLGRYTPGVLETRIVETTAGAVIGMVVALVVLPDRPGPAVRQHLGRTMRATSAVLAEIAERRTGTTLLARVHQVDREVADARTQYAALVRPLAVLPRRAGPEGEVRDLMALAHHVHVLAAEALQDPGIAASDGAPAAAACTARRLEDLADRFSDDGPAASAAPPEERRTTATADDADPLVREIAHIDSLVGRLARSGR